MLRIYPNIYSILCILGMAQVANDQQHLDVERLDFGRAQGPKWEKGGNTKVYIYPLVNEDNIR